jgi:CRISPR-associated exonuclease Cas4
MCLEEMTGTTVDEGRLYLVASNSTEIVDVASSDLRRQVCDAADQIRAARKRLAILPEPANDVRCPACSLNEACLPSLVGSPHRQRGLHGATAWP